MSDGGPLGFDYAEWDAIARFLPSDVARKCTSLLREAVGFAESDRHFVADAKFKMVLKQLAAPTPGPTHLIAASALRENESEPLRVASAMACKLAADFVRTSPAFRTATRRSSEAREVLAEATLENRSWKPHSVDDAGNGTYYRGEAAMSSHSFKVVGTVEADLVALACVLLELDLYKEWFPFCYASELLADEGRFSKSSMFAIRVPWPLSNREVCISGFGLDDLEHSQIVVKAAGIEWPVVTRGAVRADIHLCGFHVQALGRTSSRITYFVNIDPHVPHLPPFILNWINGQLMREMLRQLSKAAKGAACSSSAYYKRREARPDVYRYLRERADETIEQLESTRGAAA